MRRSKHQELIFSSLPDDYYLRNARSMKIMGYIMIAMGIGFGFLLDTMSASGAVILVMLMAMFGSVFFYFSTWMGSPYIQVSSDQMVLRNQRFVLMTRAIKLKDMEATVITGVPSYKMLLNDSDQITIFFRGSRPYSLRGAFIKNMGELEFILKAFIKQHAPGQRIDLEPCFICNIKQTNHRCITCGRIACTDCNDASECLECRISRLFGRANACMSLSLLAAIAYVVTWPSGGWGFNFLTGFAIFPYGIASLLAGFTTLHAYYQKLAGKKNAWKLIERAVILGIMASILLSLRIFYYTWALLVNDVTVRGLVIGELGVAEIVFLATFFISKYYSANRGLIEHKIRVIMLFTALFIVVLCVLSGVLFSFLPAGQLPTLGGILGVIALVWIAIGLVYLGMPRF